MLYDFDYFCGANVVVEVAGFPALEAVALSVRLTNSRRPIYGYSSHLFDAVAEGQAIVQGSLVINYVHNDYLFRLIQIGKEEDDLKTGFTRAASILGTLNHPVPTISGLSATPAAVAPSQANPMTAATIDNQKYNIWGSGQALSGKLGSSLINGADNPSGISGPVDIRVTFGERHQGNQYNGLTGYIISTVFFTGRGSSVQIDENVIVEEYPFFARNIQSIHNEPTIDIKPVVVEGEPAIQVASQEPTTTIP